MKTIAVIFGGRSTEHDVSIITAISSVIKPLELTREYQIEAVYIAKDGSWYWDNRLKNIKMYQHGEIQNFMRKAPKAQLLFDKGLTLVKKGQFASGRVQKKIDLVFPAMHGTYGEDGDLMGLLEMADVPYVGCGVSAAAVAMDKVLAKLVAQAEYIPTPKFLYFNRVDLERDINEVCSQIKKGLAFPLFIKPAHLGSSIGISRAANDKELLNGLEVASHYDTRVLVEEAVGNLVEVTLPIIGNDEPLPALLEMPLTKPEDFFDFDTKYMQGGKKGKAGGETGAQGYSQIPAELEDALYKKAEALGISVYKALGCSGIARVDMLIDSKSREVYFNEVNPLPGGLYAHNWAKAGISNVELVSRLVGLAEERWLAKQRLTTTFSTNYLKQF